MPYLIVLRVMQISRGMYAATKGVMAQPSTSEEMKAALIEVTSVLSTRLERFLWEKFRARPPVNLVRDERKIWSLQTPAIFFGCCRLLRPEVKQSYPRYSSPVYLSSTLVLQILRENHKLEAELDMMREQHALVADYLSTRLPAKGKNEAQRVLLPLLLPWQSLHME